MKHIGPNRKAEADKRQAVICPRCGNKAVERTTRYGIRSECCGLHSWDRTPLVDQKTHDARKKLSALMVDLKKNLGSTVLAAQISIRTSIPWSDAVNIQTMNEVTCNKIIKSLENVLVDIMAGSIPLQRK